MDADSGLSDTDAQATSSATDDVNDDTGSVPPGLECDPEELGTTRMWRLTPREYDASVAAILGDLSTPAADFVQPTVAHSGLSNASDDLTVGDVEAFDFQRAAQSVAASTAEARLDRVFECGADRLTDEACVETFIREVGRRLYRRPLTSAEVGSLVDIYGTGVTGYGERGGVQTALEAMLQSPFFLYKTELGSGPAGPGEVVRLSAYEIATSLSFTMLGAPPDDALLDAAEAGLLDTDDGVREEATRLLEDPAAALGLAEFYRQLFGVAEMERVEKDGAVFEDYDATRRSMSEEFERFIQAVFDDGDASLDTLLTADFAVIDERLAALYGVTLTGDDWERVDLAGTGRAGLLTMPAVLAAFAGSREPSIAKRGAMIRRRLLCQDVPDPQPEVFDNLPPVPEGSSGRDYLEMITADAGCQACHALINGPGFAFDRFDAIGGALEDFDASGELFGTRDVDGAFDDAPGLSAMLANSAQVQECFVTGQFTYALGRDVELEHSCSLQRALEAFQNSGGDLATLAVATVTSDVFLYRRGQ